MVTCVEILHKPRTTGDPNKYLNIQLIAGKDHPMISVIDVLLGDVVIQTVGVQKLPGQVPTGNQGSSACGHPAWFDSHHFGLVDRINDVVKVYKVTETGSLPNRFTFTKIQDLPTPTGSHTIDSDEIHYALREKIFFMQTEGSSAEGETPGLYKLRWDGYQLSYLEDGSGNQIKWNAPAPSNTDDASHHYGYRYEANEIWYPTFKSGTMWVLDADDLSVKTTYPVGWGAGHVNFSYQYQFACVTNHFDNIVTIVDMTDGTVHDIVVNTQTPIPYPGLIQTHENQILPYEYGIYQEDNAGQYYFLGITTPTTGEFKRIDLRALRLTGSIVVDTLDVGGHPEQSTS